MIRVYTIGTLCWESGIRENLFNELNYLVNEGIKLDLSEDQAGKCHWFNCSLVDGSGERRLKGDNFLRAYLANIITDLLLNQLTKVFMDQMLKNRYHYFDPSTSRVITEDAYADLNRLYDSGDGEQNFLRHQTVFKVVDQYLSDNSRLYLEGFFRFRLKSYFHEVTEALEAAVNRFLAEEEYQQFVELLRRFAELQDSKIDEVEILVKSPAEIYMLDETGHPVLPSQVNSAAADNEGEWDYEDWLLGALITIAPQKIFLHMQEQPELVRIICDVFLDKVILCKGCALCTPSPTPDFE